MKLYKKKGELKDYKSYCENLKNAGISFKTETYGSTAKIIFGNGTIYVFTDSPDPDPELVQLCKVTSLNANKFLRNNHVPANLTAKPIKKYNKQGIIDMIGNTAKSIDLKHCYWRVAFLEGIITQKNYEKGIEPDGSSDELIKKFKQRRLIAIGTLNKHINLTNETGDISRYQKNTHVCWDYILFKVAGIYRQVYDMLGKDFLWWQTDVTKMSRANEIKSYLDGIKMLYSVDNYYFDRIENNKLIYLSEVKQKEKTLMTSLYTKNLQDEKI
jgi:hypothetical protein